MKMLKIIAAIAAFLIFVPFKSANAQVNLNLGNIASSLTGNTGSSAGLALLNLYTQFKADGKLDLSSLGNAAVSAATAKAKSNLLGQMAKATKDTADNGDTQKAGSILTDLFKSLK